MDDTKKRLIAEAFTSIVEKSRHGGPRVRIGIMSIGSELGTHEVLTGARQAMQNSSKLEVVAIGPRVEEFNDLTWIETKDSEEEVAKSLEKALADGSIDGAVAMHFPFPVGVTTIGRIVTPAKGKPMFIASCTGASASTRTEALIRNAVYGIATAKACGTPRPSLAFLNSDGAGPVLRALTAMQEKGYAIDFATSERGDGGSLLRGNDIVSGGADVLVCDTLTGNSFVKIFSTFTTGGMYESTGYGYGPSVGDGWKKIVSIISRASGAPVIANALVLTAQAALGKLPEKVEAELKLAKQYGFEEAINALKPKAATEENTITKPACVPVDGEISGIDVLDMDSAAQALWKENIYAESAMGCTGPVIRVPASAKEAATKILQGLNFI